MSASTAAYTIPAEPGRYGALMLAVLMHLALMFFFWFGIRWQNNEPVTVEAEVWDVKIREAAPKVVQPPPVEVKPEPRPVPKQEIKPEPTPEPKAEVKPDLVLERELKKKEQKKQEKLALEEKKKKEEKEKLARLEEEKRLDQLKQDKADKAKKDKELAKEKAKREKEEQIKIDKLRADQMARITSGNGPASATGEAARSTGPRGDPNYAQAIRAKIKSSLNFGGDAINSNPKVVFKVDLLPSGEVLNVKLLKSSGIPAFDEAVEKAINKASPLPKKKDGSVDREIEVTYNLKE